MTRPLDQLAEIAQKAVAIGNGFIKNTRPQTVTEKSDRDTYTDVDLRIEAEIRGYLADVTPEIGFVGEEGGRADHSGNSDSIWTLDPIDGTANFVHQVPLCAVQIALIKNGITVVAAVSLPYLDTHYWAAEGCGAFANGVRIQVSGATKLSKSIVSTGDYATGNDAAEKNERRFDITKALASRVERIRMFGSAAHDLVWVADGRIDATVILSNKVHDVAPGVLIAREAGALVRDSFGVNHTRKSLDTVVASPGIVDELLTVLRPE